MVLESFQPDYWGGRETRWNRLIPRIAAENELTIYGDFSRISSDEAFPNTQFASVNIGPLPWMYHKNGRRSLIHAIMFTLRVLKRVKTPCEILLVDQTPLFSIPLFRILAYIKKFKIVVVWHEIWDFDTWFRYSKFMALLGYALQEVALKFSYFIVVPSQRVLKEFTKRSSSSRVIMIPNGVDILPKNGRQISLDVLNSEIQLLYVGRLIKHKNCDFLINLMSRAQQIGKNWKLTIVGSGPDYPLLVNKVRELQLTEQIRIYTDVENEELVCLYRESDIFVFPSEREGFGISVAEALSYDLPVILYGSMGNAATDLLFHPVLGKAIDSLSVEEWLSGIEEYSLSKNPMISRTFYMHLESWDEVAKKLIQSLKNDVLSCD